MSHDVKNVFSELVRTLVAFIEEKDEYLRGHADRVASMCVLFARQLELSKEDTDGLYLAGLLHDIGMVTLPQSLVEKTEDLTGEELEQVRAHPEIAEKILSSVSVLKEALPAIRHHHEMHDGSGYPDGLKGEDIPLSARIITLVDSYFAMTSPRAHRKALSEDAAAKEIRDNAGRQFDPRLTDSFLELVKAASGVSPEQPKRHKKPPENIREALAEIIRSLNRGETDVPVLPKIIKDIEELLKKPTTGSDELADLVEKDAVISVKLISTGNSPLYRGTDKIHTVRQAVPRIGMKETQNIITTIATKNIYKTKNTDFMMLMEKLWLHALATAYASKAIAGKLSLEDLDKFYLMGLVHDIGKVLLLKALTDGEYSFEMPFAEVVDGIQEVHANFGASLIQKWEFTPEFVKVVDLHDGAHFSEATKKEVLVVSLANMLTRKIGLSQFSEESLNVAEIEPARLLEMDAGTLDAICEEVRESTQKSANAF